MGIWLAHKTVEQSPGDTVPMDRPREGQLSGSPGEPLSVPQETGVAVTHFRQKGRAQNRHSYEHLPDTMTTRYSMHIPPSFTFTLSLLVWKMGTT